MQKPKDGIIPYRGGMIIRETSPSKDSGTASFQSEANRPYPKGSIAYKQTSSVFDDADVFLESPSKQKMADMEHRIQESRSF